MLEQTRIAFVGAALVASAAGAANAGGTSEVGVLVKGGVLVLSGDDGPSQVVVRATASADTFVVEGFAGTNVNGGSGGAFAGVTRGFKIDLGGGNNELLLTAGEESLLTVPGAFSYRSADGGDLVVLDHASFPGKFAVNTGAGDDTVFGYVCAFAGAARVATGEGADLAFLDNSESASKLGANLGLGDDEAVILDSVFAGRVSLLLGAGGDVARFHAVQFGALAVNGSSGSDAIVRTDDFLPGVEKLTGIDGMAIVPDPNQVTAAIVDHPGVERAIELIEDEGTGPS
jgi:hypothetical protein